jgi:hypothetical protein
MKLAIATGLAAFGFLLLVLSAIWSHVFSGSSQWTLEKDTRWKEIKNRVHVLQFTVGQGEARPSMHGGPDLLKAKDELAALMKENDELTAEFSGIQRRPQIMTKALKWSGISLAILGIIGVYAVNQQR